MNRSELVKELLKKSILPIVGALLLFLVAKEMCTKDGVTDYFYVWAICGIPFGIGKIRTWFYVRGGSVGINAAIFIFYFILAGLIGSFILIWRLIVAVYYIPVSIIRCRSASN